MHVIEGGGSFGRKLFCDAALEAAEVSKAIGKPVKLMWHRTDDFRQGRVHPMATSRVRATLPRRARCSRFDQRHTSVATDFSHGLGEIITAAGGRAAAGWATSASPQTIFELTPERALQLRRRHPAAQRDRHAASTPAACATSTARTCARARELMVDQLAAAMGKDPLRSSGASSCRTTASRAVLDKVAEVGSWGRAMPAGTAQGIAVHSEYKGRTAVPGRDRLPARRPSTGRSATRTPGRASPRPSSPSTSACRSTRAASRRR